MIICTCIKKFRNDNNKIVGYRLRDKDGNEVNMMPDELKDNIRNRTLSVNNLTLTSDNRLITKGRENINNTTEPARVLGKAEHEFMIRRIVERCSR